MSELKISLGQGNLSQGCTAVKIELRDVNNTQVLQEVCSLEAAQDLEELYKRWQFFHHDYYNLKRWHSDDFLSRSLVVEDSFQDNDGPDEIIETAITNFSQYSALDLSRLSNQLVTRFNDWLNGREFNIVEKKIRAHLDLDSRVRVIIETENEQLRKLPWWRWKFFEEYQNAGIALSALKGKRLNNSSDLNLRKLKVLSILGDDEDIDINTDKELISNISNVTSSFLEQPTEQELYDLLWSKQWDILFFSGHSSGEGYIKLNKNKKLFISELTHVLERAIQNRLSLAIFNSCDGLTLAQHIISLNLPAAIVMREPVPNKVAQVFLKFFLESFSKGTPLDIAVIEAQRRLRGIEKEFPGASLLPILVQNPTASLIEIDNQYSSFLAQILALKASFFISLLVIVLRLFGVFEHFELKSFDSLMRLRSIIANEQPDDRILVIQATPDDINNQEYKPENDASLSEHTLDQLFQKLQKFEPKVIGLDILRDFPVDANTYPELASALGQQNLYGICAFNDEDAPVNTSAPMAPPSELQPNNISFANAIKDSDGILRRHLLSKRKPSDVSDPCTATNNLSLLLVLNYLSQLNPPVQWEITSHQELKLGNVVLTELKSNSGGYHNIDVGGRQILLNYRALDSPREISTSFTVDDILNDRIIETRIEELKGRIVLIGISGPVGFSEDYWHTPYSSSQISEYEALPGVFIQAHMVSQLLSAVLNGRPLLWVWPGAVEILWILGWGLIGGIFVNQTFSYQKDLKTIVTLTVTASGFLYMVCCFTLINGGWIPFIPAEIALVTTVCSQTLLNSGRNSARILLKK